MFEDFMEARTALFAIQSLINRKMENCDAESQQKVIGLSNLESVVEQFHYDQLLYGAGANSSMSKAIEIWLNLWYPESQEQDFQLPSTQSELQEPQSLQAVPPPRDDEALSSESDDELIEVDNEARVLQEGRIIEGEVIELPTRRKDHNTEQETNIQTIPPKKVEVKNGWKTVQLSDNQRKKRISQGFKNKPMSEREVSRVHDVWKLNDSQRWKLYLYWTNEYIKLCKERVNENAHEYIAICNHYAQCQRNIDCYVAKGADVIGMTTTGAAKYHHLLKSIHPKIVIFEEAAEVLEAHVITSIAPSVQQLIMIGDHKQLKPKPACYNLEKDYNLDVSLFERLILNGFEHVTLEKQHRMRPEISKLICPIIYEKLLDAENVTKYGHVLGVGKDVFFIAHTQPEESNSYNDMKSHVNKFEAEYIVELCHYLLKQGYSPFDITILTMYRGQLLELRSRMKRQNFEGVRVAAVDDFQGEENEIILLSLVRSNSDSSIGFLKIENRVCVSLSRAKRGLYVIGNLSMLRDKGETKWPEIIHHLEKEQCIGMGLPLYCQVHQDDKVAIRYPSEFRQRPEGGCTRKCGTRLACGHACGRICHPKDREHKTTICSKVCGKVFPCGHNCKRKCYECQKKQRCLPCSERVQKVLPHCGHSVKLACSADSALVSCPLPCGKVLPCGHQCQNTCSVPCNVRCMEKIKKLLPCGHTVSVSCSESPVLAICPVTCGEKLECGDMCSGTCGKCERGRLHVKCEQRCGRDLVCGHPCSYPCASICPPCEKHCNNYCFHSNCPKKCYELCTPCMEQCEWKCPHFKCTKPCGELCNRPPCDLPCRKVLKKCGHPCIGLCGERCPKKCRICDKDEVCEILFGNEDEEDALFIELQDCGHIIEVDALDNWMQMKTSNSEPAPNSQLKPNQVQFKACPKCKTLIRKSLRYGNIIKEVLKDVEAIKCKQIEASSGLTSKLSDARQEILDLGNSSYIQGDLKDIQKSIDAHHRKHASITWYRATALKFQLSVLPKILKISKILDVNLKPFSGVNISGCSQSSLQKSLTTLKSFLMQEFLSTQQSSDCMSELRRLNCAANLLDLLCKMRVNKCEVSPSDHGSIVREIGCVHFSGLEHEKMTEEKLDQINKLIRNMSTKYKVEGLSKEEQLKIVAAIGLSKGHWFKCPKGHFYCIGECGGATERATCPECESTIGGQNHALATGNVHAGELDGSRHAAWSDMANLENFDPAELARLRI